jgi:molybdopterin-biosynthesis enzyme MoeA-like protein
LTVCRNIFILPGEPEIVKKKFNDIRDTFVSGTRVSSRYVFLSCEEISVAEALDKLAELFPHLTIGSYPCSSRVPSSPSWSSSFAELDTLAENTRDPKTIVHLECIDAELLEKGCVEFLKLIDSDLVVRIK